MRENPGEFITRYDICQLISNAFLKSFTPANLVTSFRKTGIFPIDPGAVSSMHFLPAEHLNKSNKKVQKSASPHSNNDVILDNFLKEMIPSPKPPKATKRKYKYRPGGVAITEERIVLKIRKVLEESTEAEGSCKGKQCSKKGAENASKGTLKNFRNMTLSLAKKIIVASVRDFLLQT